jgi:PAS domain S-box-containing protein
VARAVKKANILIVEDERLVAGYLADSLVTLGYAVSGIAASGEEALRRAEEKCPDLALLDIKLQGEMDGVDLARAMRARFDIPVIYQTAYHDDILVKRAADTEPYGFIVKPYDLHELRSTIEIAFHKHAMERRLRESEARYRALVESSVQGLVVLEGQPPRIVLANAPSAAITGYAVEQLVSLRSDQLAALIHPQDRAWVLTSLENYRAGRPVPAGGELRIVRQDGAERWVEYFSSLVEHEGRPALQAAFVDITERTQAVNTLVRAHNELEQRVADRTAELVRANTLLKREIAARLESEETLQRRNRELQMLYHSTQELSSSLDLDHVVSTVLDEVRHLLNASGCTLWLADQGEDELTCWQAAGPHSHVLTGLQVPVGKGIVGWVAQNHESLLVPDTRTDDRHFKQVDRSIGVETRCILSVPLRVKERLIGVIQVVGEKPESFDEDDLGLLEPLAISAAIAIENAGLYDEANALRAFNEGIVQSVQEGIFLEDEEGKIVFANPATAEMLCTSVEELIGKDRRHYVAPEAQRGVRFEADEGKKAAGSRYESVFLTGTGGRLPVMVSAQPVFEGGRLSGTLVVFMDISERKRSEIALRKRHRELTLLNRVIAASAASLAIHPILGVMCQELALAFDVPHSAAVLLNDDRTRATIVAEHQANGRDTALGGTIEVARDPAIRYLVEHGSPIATAEPQALPGLAPNGSLLHLTDAFSTLAIPLTLDGEVVGGLGMSSTQARFFSAEEIELAERVAEQTSGALERARLTETQARLSAAVEQAADAVLITDTDGSILYVNPAFEQTTGYSQAEVIGQYPDMLNSGQQETALYQEVWADLRAASDWRGRLVNRRKDGARYVADVTIAPVHNRAGEIVNFVATMRDVTRMVQLEQQAHHGQKMEALGRLAGSIAHDFGNLLTVVESGAAVLLLQMSPDDFRREQVEQIQRTGERGRELTQQLLRFSRRGTSEPDLLDLNRVIDDMAWTLERLLGSSIQVTTQLAEDLWPIRVGVSHIEQVLMNLVINARDAMPDGGTLTIETANEMLDAMGTGCELESGTREGVQLTIRDTGVGMDDEVRARLFEPFFTTKKRGEGTGLGLSTVFAIVQQSGGYIRVDSEVGLGATFRICFPRARVTRTEAAS